MATLKEAAVGTTVKVLKIRGEGAIKKEALWIWGLQKE